MALADSPSADECAKRGHEFMAKAPDGRKVCACGERVEGVESALETYSRRMLGAASRVVEIVSWYQARGELRYDDVDDALADLDSCADALAVHVELVRPADTNTATSNERELEHASPVVKETPENLTDDDVCGRALPPVRAQGNTWRMACNRPYGHEGACEWSADRNFCAAHGHDWIVDHDGADLCGRCGINRPLREAEAENGEAPQGVGNAATSPSPTSALDSEPEYPDLTSPTGPEGDPDSNYQSPTSESQIGSSGSGDGMAPCDFCAERGFFVWQHIDGQDVRVHDPDCLKAVSDAGAGPGDISDDDLWDAIDHLWGELPVETVKEIEREIPGLAALCMHAHHRMSHEQRMVRRPSWASSDESGHDDASRSGVQE